MDLLRRVVFSQVSTTGVGSADFGVFPIAAYARLTGFVKVDSVANNTANLQFRFQAQSGSTLITSAIAVASGGSEFNFSSVHLYTGLALTPVQSASAYTVAVFGEQVR